MRSVTTLLLSILVSLTAQAEDAQVFSTVKCELPKSPVFKEASYLSPRAMTLIADFKKVNEPGFGAGESHRAVLSILNDEGKMEVKPVLLTRRGKSRGSYCEAPPLRVAFVDSLTIETIEKQLSQEGLDLSSARYLPRYLELFKVATLDAEAQKTAHGTGLFAKIGDDIKLVTHCGKNLGFEQVGGVDDEAQKLKLMSEYYVYKILSLFRAPVESVRLLTITYLDPAGQAIYGETSPKFGFFREPPRSLAKRCNLQTKSPEGVRPARSDNPASRYQADFLNKFVFNTDYYLDGHNVNILYDANGVKHYGPYDYDLSEIFTDGYRGTYDSDLSNFKYILNKGDALSVQLSKQALGLRADISRLIDEADLSQERKDRFHKWLKGTMEALDEFLAGEKAI